ncbi:hypothetical protein [Campylobacter troglodytis]|nr:hypothetical protein [Campylobacter troglodytis]
MRNLAKFALLGFMAWLLKFREFFSKMARNLQILRLKTQSYI